MDWPAHCPRGHPLGPGKASLSYSLCDPCRTGHHRLHCTACRTRIWLEHPEAAWEAWDGSQWQPINAPDAPRP